MIRDVICQLKNQDTQLYNYIASHNGFTLCDVVSYDGKHNEANGENNLDGPDYNYSLMRCLEQMKRRPMELVR